MKTIGSYEAKTSLSKILEKVAMGESFTITKRGQPVAILCPPQTATSTNIKKTIEELKKFGANHSLGKLKLRALIEEGRS